MPVADIILKNANVITMDLKQPTAELVAIKGDSILLVASKEELELVAGAGTKIVDCQSKTVVPGFNDAHCHFFSFLRKLLSIDLSPSSVSSISDIKEALYNQAQNTPLGRWLAGTGYNEFYLTEKRHPTRWDIDEIAPHHPVVLAQRSLHTCVLNSLALSLADITKETPGPPGGLIDRDPNTGEPSGLLHEMLGYIREEVMPPLSEEELMKGTALANQHYLSCGITSLQEATVVNDLSRWQTLYRLKENGRLTSRVYMMFGAGVMNQFQEAGLALGSGDSQLRLGGVKIIVGETTGKLYPPQTELNQQVFSAHQAGFQLAIHATRPNTVQAAIIALEYAHSHLSETGRRHRIEHCSVCPPRLLKRLSKLQAVIVTQPPFVHYGGERYLETMPASQLRWLHRFKSFLNSGLIIAASSDSPIVPDNPLVGIYAAVTRQTESGQALLLQECVSAEQALAMYTMKGAYASFEEGMKGSITQGKLADMVVLSDDPVKALPEKVKDIKVEMTIIDGKVVWEA
ncbi:amidohydrolase [Chloroflexota bacterium]